MGTIFRGLCRPPHFHGVRQSRKEDHLVYPQFVVEGKFGPPTMKISLINGGRQNKIGSSFK
jgi:hypothetical protein